MIPISSVPKPYKGLMLTLGLIFITVTVVKTYTGIKVDLKELKES